MSPSAVVYDLASRAGVADRTSGFQVILFGTPAAEVAQRDGFWREGGGSGEPFAWVRQDAAVAVSFDTPAARAALLDLAAFKGVADQVLRLSLESARSRRASTLRSSDAVIAWAFRRTRRRRGRTSSGSPSAPRPRTRGRRSDESGQEASRGPALLADRGSRRGTLDGRSSRQGCASSVWCDHERRDAVAVSRRPGGRSVRDPCAENGGSCASHPRSIPSPGRHWHR